MLDSYSHVIERSTVKLRLSAQNMACAIEELIDAMIADGSIDASLREVAIKVVTARELSASTAMGDGVAVPHGRIEGVEQIKCAIGLAPDGFVDAPSGGQCVQVVLLLLVPADNGCNHVHFMARASMRLLDAQVRDALLVAPDQQSARDLLQLP